MKTKTLYKRTAADKIHQWCIEIEGSKYRVISGLLGGKPVISRWTAATPKNTGRANSTSAEEQAKAEARSEYEKKVKAGYTGTPETAEEDSRFSVMLAHSYKDHVEKNVKQRLAQGESVYSQPKLEGIRCVATLQGLLTRKNTPILSCPHVIEALAPVFEAFPEAIVDGELYNHELRDDFDETVRLIRKTTGLVAEDFARSAEMVQYHVYDAAGIWTQDVVPWNFYQRYSLVRDVLLDLADPRLVPVRTDTCFDTHKIDFLYEMYLTSGYEGQIVRTDEPYATGARTKHLLKRKEYIDAEYVVLDIEEGIGNRAGVAGNAILRLEDGRTFRSNLKGGMEFYAELLRNKSRYIGGQATVRFTNLTPRKIPRFPRIPKDGWWPDGRDL